MIVDAFITMVTIGAFTVPAVIIVSYIPETWVDKIL